MMSYLCQINEEMCVCVKVWACLQGLVEQAQNIWSKCQILLFYMLLWFYSVQREPYLQIQV